MVNAMAPPENVPPGIHSLPRDILRSILVAALDNGREPLVLLHAIR